MFIFYGNTPDPWLKQVYKFEMLACLLLYVAFYTVLSVMHADQVPTMRTHMYVRVKMP